MTDQPRVVLASRSPRRQDALTTLGIPFDVVVSDVESRLGAAWSGADPVPVAVAKALDVASLRRGEPVLAGDTIIDLEGEPLGKPADPADALAMLRRLRGRRHAVRSAVALVVGGAGGARDQLASCEVVAPLEMRPFSDAEAEAYVATGEPLDCAGAYDVHRLGGGLVSSVEGCFSAVVGLPLVAAARLLRAGGVAVPRDAAVTCSALYGRECLAQRPESAGRCRPARLSAGPAPTTLAGAGGLPQ